MKIITSLLESNLFLENIRQSDRSKIDSLNTDTNISLTESIQKLIADIKNRGDVAIKEITLNLDGVKLDDIEVHPKHVTAALKNTDKNLLLQLNNM